MIVSRRVQREGLNLHSIQLYQPQAIYRGWEGGVCFLLPSLVYHEGLPFEGQPREEEQNASPILDKVFLPFSYDQISSYS